MTVNRDTKSTSFIIPAYRSEEELRSFYDDGPLAMRLQVADQLHYSWTRKLFHELVYEPIHKISKSFTRR